VADNSTTSERIWKVRRNIAEAFKVFSPHQSLEDIVVPIANIPKMVEGLQALSKKWDVPIPCYGHAGDGNLHANFLYQTQEERERVDKAVDRMLRECLAMGGTITGEHGIGIAKKAFLPLEQSQELIDLQKRLKQLFDPLGILNPGKMF
jgi:glycolate oxidase